VSDLFTVTLTVEIQNADGTDAPALTETRLLLRPTWSVPADRQKIRDAARQRLATERGYTETTGGDYTAVRSAPTPSNKTAWNHATPGDAGGKRPGAATNDKGKAGTTPTPTRGNATKPGATPANGKTPPRPAAPAPKPVIQ
jgi:hypothetical protein